MSVCLPSVLTVLLQSRRYDSRTTTFSPEGMHSKDVE
jgi:hypothetical protein